MFKVCTVFVLIIFAICITLLYWPEKKKDSKTILIEKAEEIKLTILQKPTELDLNYKMMLEFSDRLDEKFPDAPNDFKIKTGDLRELMNVFQVDSFRKSYAYPSAEEASKWRESDPSRFSKYMAYEHTFWIYNNDWHHDFNEIHDIWDQTIIELKNYELKH